HHPLLPVSSHSNLPSPYAGTLEDVSGCEFEALGAIKVLLLEHLVLLEPLLLVPLLLNILLLEYLVLVGMWQVVNLLLAESMALLVEQFFCLLSWLFFLVGPT